MPKSKSTDGSEITDGQGIILNSTQTEPATKFNSELLPKPYSSITRSRLKHFQLLLGLATITSPLTATIYFPLLPLLRKHFNTSAQAINLTLTIYIIFQGISPVIFGPLSDHYGRRPLFLMTLLLYVIGNVGLSLNKSSYAVLLVLRAVQSLGASAAYAISFGVVADLCPPSDRGRILGPINMALNLGACVGPIAGGAVAYTSQSYIWVFYTLVIVGVVLFAGVGLFLPETARSLVGDGSDRSRYKNWQLSWVDLFIRYIKRDHRHCERGLAEESENEALRQKRTFGIFLACFRIIFHRDTIFTLWMHGSFYVVDYAFVAALPDIYMNYNFNELYIGLAYLPRGVGIIVGSYFTGKLMDRNYRVTAREIGWQTDKATGEDLLHFPIEKARTRCSYWMLILSTTTMIGYGWAVDSRAHFSIAPILQFLQGFWGTFFYTTYSALLVDSFPQSPSTAAATTSITRTAMAAAGVAILQPLLDAAGKGWYFTVLGLWSGILGCVAVFMLRRNGMVWRRKRNGLDPSKSNISA
ncbi:major facilitator superfamily domain-containing protein [Xylaria flabelliformis]|nr:major facilitator superfamily domain-containing protein [Xylaria flabelliformis]